MATAIKTLRSLYASASLAAGGSATSSTWTLTTAFGGMLVVRITNGGTAPSVAASFVVNISADGTNWRKLVAITGDIVNSSVNDYVVELGPGVMYAQVVFTGGTGQAVTVEATGEEITSIG